MTLVSHLSVLSATPWVLNCMRQRRWTSSRPIMVSWSPSDLGVESLATPK